MPCSRTAQSWRSSLSSGRTTARLASRSIRVVMEGMSSLDQVVVDDAPCLERLIFNSVPDQRPIKIVRAPRLEVLGFLDLQLHVLEIGGIVIRAGMKVRASAMVPSLKILAVKVDNREAKMLPTLLKCFPHLETLHIMPIPSETTDIDNILGREFWETLGSCECLDSHLNTIVLHGLSALRDAVLFLKKYIFKNGKALKTMGVVCSDDVVVDLTPSSLGENSTASGGREDVSFCLASDSSSFQNAIDLAVKDPFCVLRHETAMPALFAP